METRLFERFYEEMMEEARRRLIRETGAFWDPGDLDWEGIWDGIYRALSGAGFRCLLLEFQVCDRSGKLNGLTAEEKLEDYGNRFLSRRAYREEIFEIYPELKALCGRILENRTAAAAEMLMRLRRDRERIEETLLDGRHFCRIAKISAGEGDGHCGGRTVMKLRLDCGKTIFYKPRPMDGISLFYDLGKEIETALGMRPRDIFRYLPMDSYGWSGKVQRRRCRGEEEIRNFYRRIGIQAGIGYFLGSHDFHYQNLVACGEYPVLVDLENLFGAEEGEGGLGRSVLSGGLLPVAMKDARYCAVTGNGGKTARHPVLMLRMDGNEISIVYGKPKMERGKNVPVPGVRASAFREEIQSGLNAALLLLKDLGDEGISSRLPARLSGRYLAHSTQFYHAILEASCHPSLMRTPGEREAFIRRMCPDGATREYETADLLAGDIPYFSRRAHSRSLFSSDGQEIENYFAGTLPEALLERRKKQGERDCRIQGECVRLSLVLSELNEKMLRNGIRTCRPATGEGKSWYELALEAAEEIAGRAVWSEDKTEATWLTLKYAGGKETDVAVGMIDEYLYEGRGGIALFLRSMNLVSGKYAQLCDAAENALFRYTDLVAEGKKKTDTGHAGAYCGEASVVFAYLALYGMTGREKYLRYAQRHARIVKGLAQSDRSLDLLYGNAGAIAVFCSLHDLTGKSGYLDDAREAERHLRQSLRECGQGLYYPGAGNQGPLSGMAHGNAGYLLCYGRLLRCAKGEAREAYEKILSGLLRCENGLCLKRTKGGRTIWKGEALPSWCRGYPGIWLACLDLQKTMETGEAAVPAGQQSGGLFGELRGELCGVMGLAGEMAEKVPLRESMSLCHGNLGTLLLLKEWAAQDGSPKAREILSDFGEQVRMSLSQKEIPIPVEKQSVGLMYGLSGIGYACLEMSGRLKLPGNGTDWLRILPGSGLARNV